MRIYNLPPATRGLIFDMDLTLYRHEDYYRSQIKNQVIILAQRLEKPLEVLEREIQDWEADFQARHEGRKPSFGNLLYHGFGIPIEESVELRRQAIRPEAYLREDPRLATTLDRLQERCRLVLVTNNPADIAERTLEVLGCRRFFPRIVGLDEAGHSKPHPRAFELALAALGLPAAEVVSVGDRFPVDIEVPLSLGTGGILVESMDDVYALPEVL